MKIAWKAEIQKCTKSIQNNDNNSRLALIVVCFVVGTQPVKEDANTLIFCLLSCVLPIQKAF